MKNLTIIEQLEQNLPLAFGRTEIEKLIPGVISSKSLANLSSLGEGPPSYRHGRKVFYERQAFLEWLSSRINKVGL